MTETGPFDPTAYAIVPARTFAELGVGELFRAPSRTLTEVHAGDTLYSALTISELIPDGPEGIVKADVTVHNQRGERVLSGTHTYDLKRDAS